MGLCAFAFKIAITLSGIGYPYLFDATDSMFLPLLVGFFACMGSLLAAVVVIYMDKKSEFYDAHD